jgi:hypothetical protein
VRPEKSHLSPEVKVANKIACDHAWDKLYPSISVTCSKWYIRKAPFVPGAQLWTLVLGVAASLLNKLAPFLCLSTPAAMGYLRKITGMQNYRRIEWHLPWKLETNHYSWDICSHSQLVTPENFMSPGDVVLGIQMLPLHWREAVYSPEQSSLSLSVCLLVHSGGKKR